jgi:hypothetical protein
MQCLHKTKEDIAEILGFVTKKGESKCDTKKSVISILCLLQRCSGSSNLVLQAALLHMMHHLSNMTPRELFQRHLGNYFNEDGYEA